MAITRRSVVGLVLVCSVLSANSFVATSARAAEYDVTSLGAAPLSYIEHRFDINDSGRATFTGMVSGQTHAMVFVLGVTTTDLHATAGAFGATQSRAEGINDANHVVGYAQIRLNNGSSVSQIESQVRIDAVVLVGLINVS